jgi:hypothetical protein
MGYDDDIQRLTEIERITTGRSSHFDMDEAFSARMRADIAAGLERAPIGCHHHAWNEKAQICLGPNREIPSPGRRAITRERKRPPSGWPNFRGTTASSATELIPTTLLRLAH